MYLHRLNINNIANSLSAQTVLGRREWRTLPNPNTPHGGFDGLSVDSLHH